MTETDLFLGLARWCSIADGTWNMPFLLMGWVDVIRIDVIKGKAVP